MEYSWNLNDWRNETSNQMLVQEKHKEHNFISWVFTVKYLIEEAYK